MINKTYIIVLFYLDRCVLKFGNFPFFMIILVYGVDIPTYMSIDLSIYIIYAV